MNISDARTLADRMEMGDYPARQDQQDAFVRLHKAATNPTDATSDAEWLNDKARGTIIWEAR